MNEVRYGLLLLFLLVAVPAASAQDDDPARQFDFWVGEWEVTNRFLQDDGSWMTEGAAKNQVFSILNGRALVELWNGTIRGGFRLVGFSVRYYDPEQELWQLVLNWPMPDAPRFFELEGSFRHGRGEFFRTRQDTTGADILLRYTFSDVKPSSFRWDTARSRDGGVTWRTTWIMEFNRVSGKVNWPAAGEDVLTYTDGSRCSNAEAERFDALEGKWDGTVQRRAGGAWEDGAASLSSYRILDGCAVLELAAYEYEEEALHEMRLGSFNPESRKWEILTLDSRPESKHRYVTGAWRDGVFEPDSDGLRWLHLDDRRAEYDQLEGGQVMRRVRLVR